MEQRIDIARIKEKFGSIDEVIDHLQSLQSQEAREAVARIAAVQEEHAKWEVIVEIYREALQFIKTMDAWARFYLFKLGKKK